MGAKFDKLEAKLEGEPGVTDAAGLAASIGRKKYGKANYDKAAAKDKSPKMKKSDWDELEEMVEEVEKAYGVKAGKGLFGKPPKPRGVGISTGSGASGGYGMKKGDEDLEKKQGVPEGVDPAKHERCVMDVKADGKDKSSAYAICNSSMNKSEIELEIDELSKNMELATMNPVEEIKKAVMELGPEGVRKAMPTMTEENKILLNDILEDMNKSHTLPLDAPKKLVNVGGENYVEEDVGNDDADEDIFDAAVKEGDNEQKHQGGSHDLTQPIDWKGQMIKSLDEFTADELATFGEVYKAMKMKKKEDDSVDEKVKEIEGKAKVNEVLDDTKDDKKDDVLAELRDKKIKKAKEFIKAALKKECPDMMEEKEEVEVMKKKIKKALIMALSEEYTDDEIEKAMEGGMGPSAGAVGAGAAKKLNAKAANTGAGKAKGIFKAEDKEGYESDEKYDKDEAAEAYEGRDDAEKKGEKGKAEKYEKDIESDMTDADYDKDKSEGKKKFEKAMELFSTSKELLNDGEEYLAREIFIKAKKMVADVLEMNSGVKKLSQPEPADAAKTTADAVKSPNMKKSIKWYGEENDKFAAGRLGRHNYTSSVNSYYDEMIKKADSVVHEEELKKSFNPHDIEDLIEADLMKSQVQIQSDIQMEEFKKSQGGFTTNSFDEEDMFKSLGLSTKEAYEALGKSETLMKAKYLYKRGSGSNVKYYYKMPDGKIKITGGKIGEHVEAAGKSKPGAKRTKLGEQGKIEFKDKTVSILKGHGGKWVSNRALDTEFTSKHPNSEVVLAAESAGRAKNNLGPVTWDVLKAAVKDDKMLESKYEGGTRYYRMRTAQEGPRPDGTGEVISRGKSQKPKSDIDQIMGR